MSDPTTSTDPISALQRLTEPTVQGAMQSDAELLTLFVESGSRTAIESLIQRYAGMVASVCRCTVADPTSAEDAFQATFLVLLKSAKKIQNRRSVLPGYMVLRIVPLVDCENSDWRQFLSRVQMK